MKINYSVIILSCMSVGFLHAMNDANTTSSDSDVSTNAVSTRLERPMRSARKRSLAAAALVALADPVSSESDVADDVVGDKNFHQPKRLRKDGPAPIVCPNAAINNCNYSGKYLADHLKAGCKGNPTNKNSNKRRVMRINRCPNADKPNGEPSGNGCTIKVKNGQWTRHLKTCNKLNREQRALVFGRTNLSILRKKQNKINT